MQLRTGKDHQVNSTLIISQTGRRIAAKLLRCSRANLLGTEKSTGSLEDELLSAESCAVP